MRESQNRECIFTKIKTLLPLFIKILSCVADIFYHIRLHFARKNCLSYTVFVFQKKILKKHLTNAFVFDILNRLLRMLV